MDYDQIRQDRIIEIRELDKKIVEIRQELENSAVIKQEIEDELKTIKKYRTKAQKEYESLLLELKKLNKKIDASQLKADDVKKKKEGFINDIEVEHNKKLKELESLKESKKTFITQLDKREERLNKTQQEIDEMILLVEDENALLNEKEENLEKQALLISKEQKATQTQKTQINLAERQIMANKGISDRELKEIMRTKGETTKELKKHEVITNKLHNQENTLNVREETNDKKEEFLTRRIDEVKKEKQVVDTILGNIDKIKKEKMLQIKSLEAEINEGVKQVNQTKEDIKFFKSEIRNIQQRKSEEDDSINKKIGEKKQIETSVAEMKKKLDTLDIQRIKTSNEIDDKYIKGKKDFNEFNTNKSIILKKIDNKEKDIKHRELRLSQTTSKINKEKEDLLQETIRVNTIKQDLSDRKSALDTIEAKTTATKNEADTTLNEIKTKEKLVSNELLKHERLTNSLNNQEKMLSAKIEAQDKRAKVLDREDEAIKKEWIKLEDERKTFLRAMTELRRR